MKEDIADKIRGKVIFHEFDPGEKISEETLAEEFSVSRTPIREALIKLSSEQLVDIIPNRGAYASKIDPTRVDDIMRIRKRLIGLAGRLAAKRVKDKQISEMESLLNSIEEAEETEELVKLDWEFHQLINQAAGSEFLANMLASLRNHAIRINLFPEENSFYHSFSGDFSDFIEALTKRDDEVCEKILVNHVDNFAEAIEYKLDS